MVARILGLCTAVLYTVIALDITNPNKEIGIGLEPKRRRPERVRARRRGHVIPMPTTVCCVKVLGRFGDEIRSFV